MAEKRNVKKEAEYEKLKQTLETGGRVLPNNFEAEQCVLGSAMIDAETALFVVSKVDESDFYNDTHKKIFNAIKELYMQSSSTDLVSVADKLEKQGYLADVGGMSYVSSLTNIPSSASASHYVEIVKRDSKIRKVILACGDVIKQAYEKNSDESIIGIAEKAIFDIAEQGQSGELVRMSDVTNKVFEKFEALCNDIGSFKGLKTGFYQIDKITNGLQKSDLIILAARPGVGKTSLAMNIVSNAAIETGAKCAIFSLEMGKEQLTQRMICSVGNVSMAKSLRGELDENDWIRLRKAKKQIEDAEIFIDDNAMNTPSQIMSKCRKMKREKGLDLIVIDYLGLMKSDEKSDNRQNEVANISRQLKIMAKEINVPVIALCQLNRSVEQRDNGKPGKPVLSDLRESGSIEQDADMVWFIHRDMTPKEVEENKSGDYVAELIIAKFRNGQPGSIFLNWDGSRTSFVNREKDANEQSLINQYEKNDEAKKAKKEQKSAKDFENEFNEIVNEINADEELVPPPDEEMPDFSNISVPSDDELF